MSFPDDLHQAAVLVLNFNGRRFLEDCFQSILQNGFGAFDLYLVDNGSSDGSVEWTRAHHPGVRVILLEENLGFAGAYDRAIRSLGHKYVVLLNNDTTVDSRWLEELVRVAEGDERVAACGSRVIMEHDRSVLDHDGGLFTWIGSGLDKGKWARVDWSHRNPEPTGFGCGASLLIRREAYLEVGGFDPDYVLYHEDVDLCWRLRLRGYSVMHVPSSVVYHHGGGTGYQGIDSHPSKTYFCQKNRLANLVKNLGRGRILFALLASSAYDTLRMLEFLLTRRVDLLKAIWKGYSDTFVSLKALFRKRKTVQAMRRISERDMQRFFCSIASSASAYRRMLEAQCRRSDTCRPRRSPLFVGSRSFEDIQ